MSSKKKNKNPKNRNRNRDNPPVKETEKQEIPKGASGVLGPIELDAIQKLLAEG